MDKQKFLNFEWVGDQKGIKGLKNPEMRVFIDGVEVCRVSYKEPVSFQVPLNSSSVAIKVNICNADKEKQLCYFKGTFSINGGKDYSCRLFGQASSFTGLKLKFSKGDSPVKDSDPVCRNSLPVSVLAFCFPIYGLCNAATSKYNRIAALLGTAVGLGLSTISSWMAYDSDELIGFGFGQTSLMDYEPFSAADWIINLLIGGISSLRGLLYLLIDNLLS